MSLSRSPNTSNAQTHGQRRAKLKDIQDALATDKLELIWVIVECAIEVGDGGVMIPQRRPGVKAFWL